MTKRGVVVAVVVALSGCGAVEVGDEGVNEADEALAYGTYGTFVGYGGRCLDLRGAQVGNAAQIYDCNGGNNQKWTFSNPTGPIFSAVAYAVGLTEIGNYEHANVKVSAWGAGPNAARWTMPKAKINSATGWCLTTTGPYNTVTVSYCSGPDAQWTFDESLTPIKSPDGRCLTSTSTVSGSEVILAACTGGSNQNWRLVNGGEIQQAGMCLDIRGGGSNRAAVQLYNCHGNSNQRWTLSGQVSNVESGRCLSLPSTYWGPVTASGTAVEMTTCTNYYGQNWEYRW